MRLSLQRVTSALCLCLMGCGGSSNDNSDNISDNNGDDNGDEVTRNIYTNIHVSDFRNHSGIAEIFTDEPIPYVIVPELADVSQAMTFGVFDYGDDGDASSHPRQILRIHPDEGTTEVTHYTTTQDNGTIHGVPISILGLYYSENLTVDDSGIIFVISVTPDPSIVEVTTADNIMALQIYVTAPDSNG